MASAEAADETSAPVAAQKPAKGKGGAGMLIAAVVLSVAASGGVSFFMSRKAADAEGAASHEGQADEGDEAKHEGPPAAANYLALEPAFLVNLEDPEVPRFLQTEIQLMSRDAPALEAVKAQTPRLRNTILLLLGQQKPADLVARAGKEKLQAEVLAEVQKVMQEETGKPVVEAVYFTSFVMQ